MSDPEEQTPRPVQRPTMARMLSVEVERSKGTTLSPELAAQLAATHSAFNSFAATFREQIANIAKSTAMEALRAAIPDLTNIVQAIGASFDEVPAEARRAMVGLGMRGWYLDPEIAYMEFISLHETGEAGDHDTVDQRLSAYYEERLDDIEATICAGFPNREKIFRAAIDAHRRGEYVLSVPVLLAQADGVCFELTGASYFRTRRGLPAPAAKIGQVDPDLQGAWLTPLMVVLPVSMSEEASSEAAAKELRPGWMELNRHTVLHGKDLAYGTPLNSLKALSLLNYLVAFAAPLLAKPPRM